MITQAIFTMPNAQPGEVLVNNRYVFTDGKHVRNADDGKLLEPVLCAYYGCSVEWVDDTPVVDAVEPEAPTLAKTQTSKAK